MLFIAGPVRKLDFPEAVPAIKSPRADILLEGPELDLVMMLQNARQQGRPYPGAPVKRRDVKMVQPAPVESGKAGPLARILGDEHALLGQHDPCEVIAVFMRIMDNRQPGHGPRPRLTRQLRYHVTFVGPGGSDEHREIMGRSWEKSIARRLPTFHPKLAPSSPHSGRSFISSGLRVGLGHGGDQLMKRTLVLCAAAAAATFGACAAKPAPAPVTPEPQLVGGDAVHSYILLDRTGSMSGIWDEALTSVNAYAAEVGKAEEGETDDLDTSVTLAVFDAQDGLQYDVLRESVKPTSWTAVTSSEVSPRGMTPLFDAIGRIVATAEADNPEKAVIVIMTDGMENSSREITKDGARAALDRVEAKGWEVVFLGAEFAKFDDADAVGVSASKSMAMGAGTMQESMSRLAKKSRSYGKGEEAEIVFDAEDRAIAEEEDVKQRKGN